MYKRQFLFPEPLERCEPVSGLLDNENTATSERLADLSKLPAFNVHTQESLIQERGGNPKKESWILDCDAAKANSFSMKDVSPCITRSRYKGHWITNVQRRMTITEMCRFQGFNPTKLKHCVSDTELGHMLGNAMSVNIIERILFRVIRRMEFAKLASTVDRWESGEALRELRSSKNKKLHRVVCTWNSSGGDTHTTSLSLIHI